MACYKHASLKFPIPSCIYTWDPDLCLVPCRESKHTLQFLFLNESYGGKGVARHRKQKGQIVGAVDIVRPCVIDQPPALIFCLFDSPQRSIFVHYLPSSPSCTLLIRLVYRSHPFATFFQPICPLPSNRISRNISLRRRSARSWFD